MNLTTKVCTQCKKSKPFSGFDKAKYKPFGLSSECKLCHKLYADKHYIKNRKRLIACVRARKIVLQKKMLAYKKSLSCLDCGLSDHRVLDFDHLRDKSINIAKAVADGWGWCSILKELEKCEPVCSNCHRIRTYNRRISNGPVAE